MKTPTEKIREILHLHTFENRFDLFLKGCQRILDKEKRVSGKVLVAEEGKRYVRIWCQSESGLCGRSAWAFVDKTNGDVLKPATWRAPAKHARGNIFDSENGLSRITRHGPEYLR